MALSSGIIVKHGTLLKKTYFLRKTYQQRCPYPKACESSKVAQGYKPHSGSLPPISWQANVRKVETCTLLARPLAISHEGISQRSSRRPFGLRLAESSPRVPQEQCQTLVSPPCQYRLLQDCMTKLNASYPKDETFFNEKKEIQAVAKEYLSVTKWKWEVHTSYSS